MLIHREIVPMPISIRNLRGLFQEAEQRIEAALRSAGASVAVNGPEKIEARATRSEERIAASYADGLPQMLRAPVWAGSAKPCRWRVRPG